MCMKLQTCKYSTISAVELGSSKALDSEFVKARFWFIDCFATCSNAGLWNRADAQSLSCSLFFFLLNFKEQPPEYFQVQKRDKAGHFIGREIKSFSQLMP